MKNHKKITENDLGKANGLPTAKVIYNIFGSLNEFQKIVGSELTFANEPITKELIKTALSEYFGNSPREIESIDIFFKSFKYSKSVVLKKYGGVEHFVQEENITLLRTKKAKYTKREVDDAVLKWVKSGNEIPKAHELAKLGLPSMSVIMKYYENWKEPFYIYMKMNDEIQRK